MAVMGVDFNKYLHPVASRFHPLRALTPLLYRYRSALGQ